MEKLEKQLKDLWEKYLGQFDQKSELYSILKQRMCYSIIEKPHRILVTGMNPSYRKKDMPVTPDGFKDQGFTYQDCISRGDDYYTKFDALFPKEYKQEISYLDLFNIRETDQKVIEKFCKDPKGMEFMATNLRINQLFMEEVVRPRFIMVKNRGSWCFWGKEAKNDKKDDKNIWMGYTFEPVEEFKNLPYGEVCRITGLVDDPERVSYHELKETNLKGTLVLFTCHYVDYHKDKFPTPELIADLCSKME